MKKIGISLIVVHTINNFIYRCDKLFHIKNKKKNLANHNCKIGKLVSIEIEHLESVHYTGFAKSVETP